MRGSLAKQFRAHATGLLPDGSEALDRQLYQALKKLYKRDKPRTQPKFPKLRKSKWKQAKLPAMGSGVYFHKAKPLAFLADIFIDLSSHGKLVALNLVKLAERISKPDLEARIKHFKETHVRIT